MGPTAIPGLTVSGVNGLVNGVGRVGCKELRGSVTPNISTNGDGGGEFDQWERGSHTGALLKLGAQDHFRDLS